MHAPDREGTPALSIITGPPLADEPGIGSLTLGDYLREVTGRFAGREALVMHTSDGVERWTYATLWARSMEVARALRACGIGKDARVGILMTNRVEWVASVFGTSLAGGVAVALSTFAMPSEMAYLLKASGVSVLLLERRVAKKDFLEILAELEPATRVAEPGRLQSVAFPSLRHLAVVDSRSPGGSFEGWQEFLARGTTITPAVVEAAATSVMPSDSGLLLFSSGTTNKPKGILNSHRGVAIQLWRMRRIFALEDDVRCWTPNGFFWSGNFAMALGGTFSSGGSIVLQPIFDPDDAVELIQAERVSFPLAWPHQWAQLEQSPRWGSADLGSFRYVDPKTPAGRHPTVSTRWSDPVASYGSTETFTISTVFPSDTPPEVIGGSNGKALPGNTVKVVDRVSGAMLPRGQRGEIAVKGPTLMLGYLGVPADETLDGEGFFRTGDEGFIDVEGRLVFEGRLTDIIKTGGANVSPVEVDGMLDTHPGVKLTKTVGVPHETLGEMVVSCIVRHDHMSLDESAVREFLREHLASYKVPRRVLFFREGELTLTATGKVKGGDLQELVAKRLDVADSAA